jgi:hypothetical protein
MQAAAPGDTVLLVGGMGRSSAHEQRSDIERIRKAVVRCQKPTESQSLAPTEEKSVNSNQPGLKFFDPEA